jgi:NOL1/NOP2/sun family putative RNA methylase
MQLPEKFKAQMKELLMEEYEDYIQSFEHERYYGLRVNTLKISVEDFLKISPFHLLPIPWTSDGFYYDANLDKPSKHPYYYAGLYYLQEPSAMLPAEVLPIEHNDYVLDTCAAPGGKSTKLATKLNQTGLLISNDISSSRCQGLLKNIELFGIKNTWVTSEDLVNMESHYLNTFDKILVDAPCSGEGMFRKEPDLIKSWIDKDDSYYPPIQKSILNAALNMLKPSGYVVYSTCTFSIHENEEVIQDALNHHEDVHLMNIKKIDGMQPGINMPECVRLYPHKIHGEGHFVALLKKDGEPTNKKENSQQSDPLNEDVQDFLKLCALPRGTFKIKKDKVIWLNTDFQAYKGFRVLRSGLLIGQIKNKHFEPNQAFAMSLNENTFKNVLNLSSEDARVIKYLKGETLDVKDIDSRTNGWTLVLVDHFPLGFAKLSKGTLKNKYAKGWRYQ